MKKGHHIGKALPKKKGYYQHYVKVLVQDMYCNNSAGGDCFIIYNQPSRKPVVEKLSKALIELREETIRRGGISSTPSLPTKIKKKKVPWAIFKRLLGKR